MSVPLDRLYHYLDDVVNHDLVIYRWAPHGSRKLEDLKPLNDYPWGYRNQNPIVICHDQEPLQHNFYSVEDFKNKTAVDFRLGQLDCLVTDQILQYHANLNLFGAVYPTNVFDQKILLHSELNSQETAWFSKKGFVPVYYWSHALISKDWFRYAEHDPNLTLNFDSIDQDFLIYSRAWTGTREYRLYFTQQLVQAGLHQHCKTSFNAHDNSTHYSQYQFANPAFQISNFDLENFFPANSHAATASADYNTGDYQSTAIEVVLETLFDDSRHHLTEKILRPIACGKPFLLASTPGSLEYLKNYGFETFAEYIDESYDTVKSGTERLNAIVSEMCRIKKLPGTEKRQLLVQLDRICQRNRQRFFSKEFHSVIMKEFYDNMQHGVSALQQNKNGLVRKKLISMYQQIPQYQDWSNQNDPLHSLKDISNV